MSNDPNPVERFLDRTARRMSGARLHPLEVLQRVGTAFAASARDGVAANGIVVHLHPSDFAGYVPQMEQLRASIVAVLEEAERRLGLRRYGEWYIDIKPRPALAEGDPRVRAFFAATTATSDAPPDAGATRRLFRLQGVNLRLSDGRLVLVTHAPFSIGRGPGNDLVIPSLAVSRMHAQIRRTTGGLVIADVGSRNGIIVNGRRVLEVTLAPGLPVLLGDTTLTLEPQ